MAIVPDAKDWTWVLDRPCPECGFDVDVHPRETLGAVIRATAASWRSALSGQDVDVRRSDDRWSVLEYGCHVRNVYRIFDQRLVLMLTSTSPTFADWDQDATAAEDRYDLQRPERVAGELVQAAATVADRFDRVRDEESARRGVRSNGSLFTVETLGLYFVHDPVHHLWDVTGQ